MSAPIPAADRRDATRFRDILIAGYLEVCGVDATASCAAALTCDCSEWVCPDGTHLWLTPAVASREAT